MENDGKWRVILVARTEEEQAIAGEMANRYADGCMVTREKLGWVSEFTCESKRDADNCRAHAELRGVLSTMVFMKGDNGETTLYEALRRIEKTLIIGLYHGIETEALRAMVEEIKEITSTTLLKHVTAS